MQWDWHEYWWGLFAIENSWPERRLKDCQMFWWVSKHKVLLMNEIWISTLMSVLVARPMENCGSTRGKCLILGDYAWRNRKTWSVAKDGMLQNHGILIAGLSCYGEKWYRSPLMGFMAGHKNVQLGSKITNGIFMPITAEVQWFVVPPLLATYQICQWIKVQATDIRQLLI